MEEGCYVDARSYLYTRVSIVGSEGNFSSHFSPPTLFEALSYSKLAGLELPGQIQSLLSISVYECWDYRSTSPHMSVFFFTDFGLAGFHPERLFPLSHLSVPRGLSLVTLVFCMCNPAFLSFRQPIPLECSLPRMF